MKIRLLYIHNSSITPKLRGGLNGTLLQVFSMCNAFARAGYNVTLAMEGYDDFEIDFYEFVENSFTEGVSFTTMNWEKMSNKRIINRFLIRYQMKKLIDNVKPNIIFTREPLLLGTILKINIPVIFESHSALLHTRSIVLHKVIKREIIRASKKENLKCLFSISQALSEYWRNNGVPSDKLFCWHDGFDEKLFSNPLSKKDARNELKIPHGVPVAVYAGGLYPDREIENVITLGMEFPEVLFLIVGGPETNKKMYETIAKNKNIKNVHFIGYVAHNNVPLYLYSADILLALWSIKVPTINYCSPLKLFEYMAAGRLILTHNFPTIREVLEPDKDALFCESGSLDSLKLGFKTALEKSRNGNFGLRVRKKAFDYYTWDKRVRMLLSFLEKI